MIVALEPKYDVRCDFCHRTLAASVSLEDAQREVSRVKVVYSHRHEGRHVIQCHECAAMESRRQEASNAANT